MSYTTFHIWDIIEILEQVACFILILVTAFEHIVIVLLCNNENQVRIIHCFHIHLSDYGKSTFETILPPCIFFYKEHAVKWQSYQTFYSCFS